jgi:hypothetical protein
MTADRYGLTKLAVFRCNVGQVATVLARYLYIEREFIDVRVANIPHRNRATIERNKRLTIGRDADDPTMPAQSTRKVLGLSNPNPQALSPRR